MYSVAREPRQLFGCPVEDRDVLGPVDGDDPALDRPDDVLQVLVDQDHLLVQLRVLDRNPRLIGQGGEKIYVLRVEWITRHLLPQRDDTNEIVV